MDTEALRDQLRKQLGFLERSCSGFDSGFRDEAIRIAVSVRVLLHDTPKSTSLLTLLGAKSIFLRSTRHILEDDVVYSWCGLSSTQLTFGNGSQTEAIYQPNLDSFGPKAFFIACDSWWSQIVYRIPAHNISRKQIVLGAANKDGGAHVDPSLSAEYEALCKGVLTIGCTSENESYEYPLPDSHLADLRQMGHELLSSPDLLNLAAER